MIKEGIMLDGVMTVTLTKEDGTSTELVKHNMIVKSGIDFICDAIGASSGRPAVMGHIGVGTSNTATVNTHTALLAQISRKAASYAHVAGTSTFTVTATFGAGEATGAIQEAGVFNASSGGTMLDRVTFPVINKEDNDVLTVTFTFTLTA